ncbi:MAG: FprA family A-type flavoprotein [Lachnospiraceae bacterium]|nr:FprA family A-type flavoprotein [Lachnospiraceae bacterium]
MTDRSDIKYIGVNDHTIDMFEGMYGVPNGMAYNSYVIMDEKIAILDTVDVGFAEQWLGNIANVLGDRKPDFLIIQHMEPDHSANIMHFVEQYPQAVLVASERAFVMMKNFFGTDFSENRMVVSDGDMLSLGRHELLFLGAPMVHWPEVLVTYERTEKALFSADAFGRFGALDVEQEWTKEARRYYFGIVGKYGVFVQKLLKKIGDLDIRRICPLHGPVLSENLGYYIGLYDTWSRYQPEEEGILIAYTSVYGNTKRAAFLLAEKLVQKEQKVKIYDLARCDMSEAVAEAFRFSKVVLATTTYNAGVFPFMREFISALVERNFCDRTVAFVENGGWAPIAAKIMRESLEKCKGINFARTTVRILSALKEESRGQVEALAQELSE